MQKWYRKTRISWQFRLNDPFISSYYLLDDNWSCLQLGSKEFVAARITWNSQVKFADFCFETTNILDIIQTVSPFSPRVYFCSWKVPFDFAKKFFFSKTALKATNQQFFKEGGGIVASLWMISQEFQHCGKHWSCINVARKQFSVCTFEHSNDPMAISETCISKHNTRDYWETTQ